MTFSFNKSFNIINNIRDLILTNIPECVIDLSCTSPTSVDMFSDHKLLFFYFQVHAKLSPRECRTVFHYCQADWKNLHNDLTIGLSSILPENIDNDFSHSTTTGTTVDINIVWRNCLLNAATRQIPTKVVKRRNRAKGERAWKRQYIERPQRRSGHYTVMHCDYSD